MMISDRGGSVRSTFLRLCVRAPRTTIWPRGFRCCIRPSDCGAIRRNPEQSMVAHGPDSAQPRQQPFVLFCWGFADGGWRGVRPSSVRRNQEGAVSVRLFIGNLPYAASEAELREHLSSVGEPTQIVLPVDRETGRPRGFAFVDYADRAVAEAAISRFDQQPFKGRPLAVSEARPREDRPPAHRARRVRRPAARRSGRGRPAAASRAAPERLGAAPRSVVVRRRTAARNFGPDAPPKNKRKPPRKDRPGAKRADQGTSGQPPLRKRRGLAQRERRHRDRRHRDERERRRRVGR